MKKFFSLVIAMIIACTANAQVKEQVQQSKDRAARLQALVNDYKTCGNDNIDGYGNDVKNAAILAIANSEQLENLYKRQIGETKDGVTDVNIKKPTIEEWVTLSVTVAGEAGSIKMAVDKAQSAGKEAKNMTEQASNLKNPMKAAKAAKTAKAAMAVIEFGNVATPILIEESAAQVKAIDEIIKTLKSGKNL